MNTELFKLNESDWDKMKWESFQDEYAKKVMEGEEKVLMQVLTAYLHRTPYVEDFKRCQRIFHAGIDDEYTFCYDNFPLGCIKRSFENLSYNIKFIPHK